MQSFCAPAASDRFAAKLLADTDCQAFGLVERGYAALSQPGGTVSAALTGMMVIAVAIFGYRLLLGRGIVLSEALGLTVKLGLVLMLATSWQSWQALAYNGLAQAPTEVASEMLAGIGAPPPLESLERSLDDLTAATVGYRQRAGIASPLVGGPAAAAAALNLSAVVLTLSIVGLLVAVRVVLAIMLAIAPAMAGFLLFDATRGIAQGWLGAIAGASLAPLFVLMVAAVEFAILDPMMARLLAEQSAGNFETATVMPIGLVTIVFAIAMVLAVRSGGRIARGIRLARTRSTQAATAAAAPATTIDAERQLQRSGAAAQPRIAQVLEGLARRDSPRPVIGLRSIGGSRSSTARDARSIKPGSVADSGSTIRPTIQSGSTRTRAIPRRTRSAARREA